MKVYVVLFNSVVYGVYKTYESAKENLESFANFLKESNHEVIIHSYESGTYYHVILRNGADSDSLNITECILMN